MVLLLIIVTFICHGISNNTISHWLQCSYVDQSISQQYHGIFGIHHNTDCLGIFGQKPQYYHVACLEIMVLLQYIVQKNKPIACWYTAWNDTYSFIYHSTPKNTTPCWLDCPYVIHSENNSSNTVICWIYTIVLNVYHIHIPYYFKEYHGATPLMAKTHYDTMVHVKKTWYHYNRCLKTGTEQLPTFNLLWYSKECHSPWLHCSNESIR